MNMPIITIKHSTSAITFANMQVVVYVFDEYMIVRFIVYSFLGMDNWNFSRYPNRDYQLKWIANYLRFYEPNQLTQSTERIETLYRQVNVCASVKETPCYRL